MFAPIEKVGFVGFGAMGQFMAREMFDNCDTVAYDPRISEKQVGQTAVVGFNEALASEVVVLAVPAPALHEVADEILCNPAVTLPEDTLLVDICSVKEYPVQVFDRFLPNHTQLLLSHPLFGPESAKDSLEGHKLIVTESHGAKADQLVDHWQRLGLAVIHMTASEHDRQMAAIQAVPFVFGRLATLLELDDSPLLETPSRQAMRQLQGLDGIQSNELFDTITSFNPQAVAMLERLEGLVAGLRHSPAQDEAAKLMEATSRVLAASKV
jgi:prephenate dehydrogenase